VMPADDLRPTHRVRKAPPGSMGAGRGLCPRLSDPQDSREPRRAIAGLSIWPGLLRAWQRCVYCGRDLSAVGQFTAFTGSGIGNSRPAMRPARTPRSGARKDRGSAPKHRGYSVPRHPLARGWWRGAATVHPPLRARAHESEAPCRATPGVISAGRRVIMRGSAPRLLRILRSRCKVHRCRPRPAYSAAPRRRSARPQRSTCEPGSNFAGCLNGCASA
jgi:hypothetical protein